MKTFFGYKLAAVCLALALCFPLAACQKPASSAASGFANANLPVLEDYIGEGDYEIQWYDHHFENAVRAWLEKPEGAILVSELDDVTFLALIPDNFALSGQKGDMTFLETPNDIVDLIHFRNLNELVLASPYYSDFRPLLHCQTLTALSVYNNHYFTLNQIESMTALTTLNAEDCGLTDVSPLKGLTNLASVSLGSNEITNIDTLTKLPKLTYLNVAKNKITHPPDQDQFPALELYVTSDNPSS